MPKTATVQPATMDAGTALIALTASTSMELTELQQDIAIESARDINSGDLILPTLKGPSSTSKFFTLDEQPLQQVEAIILLAQAGAAWWPTSDPSSIPPLCRSIDGYSGFIRLEDAEQIAIAERYPVRHPGLDNGNSGPWDCAACPLNQWGSDPKEGSNSRACGSSMMMILLVPGQTTPVIFRVPKGSLKNWNTYKSILVRRHSAYFCYRTMIGSQPAKSQSGIAYNQITFGDVAELEDVEYAAVKVMRDELREYFNQLDMNVDFE